MALLKRGKKAARSQHKTKARGADNKRQDVKKALTTKLLRQKAEFKKQLASTKSEGFDQGYAKAIQDFLKEYEKDGKQFSAKLSKKVKGKAKPASKKKAKAAKKTHAKHMGKKKAKPTKKHETKKHESKKHEKRHEAQVEVMG